MAKKGPSHLYRYVLQKWDNNTEKMIVFKRKNANDLEIRLIRSIFSSHRWKEKSLFSSQKFLIYFPKLHSMLLSNLKFMNYNSFLSLRQLTHEKQTSIYFFAVEKYKSPIFAAVLKMMKNFRQVFYQSPFYLRKSWQIV